MQKVLVLFWTKTWYYICVELCEKSGVTVMQLNEIREEIDRIDEEMKQLFDERLMQSRKVAETKIASGDDVYKPLREIEMEQMHASQEEAWYLMQLKKSVEISRKYQYSVFIDKHMEDSEFLKNLSVENRKTLLEGGRLLLSFQTDSERMKGLDVKGVMSVLSSSSLRILHMTADASTDKVQVILEVDNTDASKQEAFLLAYMIYKETICE